LPARLGRGDLDIQTSDRFTIEDIHIIRYENDENTKDLSSKELIERTKQDASSSLARIDKMNTEITACCLRDAEDGVPYD